MIAQSCVQRLVCVVVGVVGMLLSPAVAGDVLGPAETRVPNLTEVGDQPRGEKEGSGSTCSATVACPPIPDPCPYIESLQVTCDLERSRLRATVSSTLPPCTRLRLVADDAFYREPWVRWNGRAKATWINPMPGVHEVCIAGCDICETATCGCATDADCDDSDLCTIDECVLNECVYAPIECNEGYVCFEGECVLTGVTIDVCATEPWSAEAPAPAATMVSVVASGEWTSGGWAGGPDGDEESGPQGGDYLLPTENAYSLIGRCGPGGEPFFVGEGRGVTECESALQLSMNDVPGIFGDNHGCLTVDLEYTTTWEEVVVSARSPWPAYITGFPVAQGDRLLIHARGEWHSGSWQGNADGDIPSGPQGGGYILPDAYAYSLIGRINDGDPFYIGAAYRGYAESSGTLYLGMNDVPGIFGDNSGAVTVKVGVVPHD